LSNTKHLLLLKYYQTISSVLITNLVYHLLLSFFKDVDEKLFNFILFKTIGHNFPPCSWFNIRVRLCVVSIDLAVPHDLRFHYAFCPASSSPWFYHKLYAGTWRWSSRNIDWYIDSGISGQSWNQDTSLVGSDVRDVVSVSMTRETVSDLISNFLISWSWTSLSRLQVSQWIFSLCFPWHLIASMYIGFIQFTELVLYGRNKRIKVVLTFY